MSISKRKFLSIIILVAFFIDFLYCLDIKQTFFNESIPQNIPKIFAQGIVTYPFMNHSAVTISKDLDEIYWSKWYDNECREEIVFSRLVNNKWSKPEVVSFSGIYSDDVPFLSPDNKRLFYISRKPKDKTDRSNIERIWYADRIEDSKWTKPALLSPVVNCERIHWQLSVAEDYTIFYNSSDGIKMSKFENNSYQTPKLISEELNSKYIGMNPYISKDQDYIIFCSDKLEDSYGKNDLYIGFKNDSGNWCDPINLGPNINGKKNELCSNVSPCGRYLFYVKQDDVYNVYWVKTDLIKQLNPYKNQKI